MIEIKNRFKGEVICKSEDGSLRELVQNNKANLRESDLWGANLREADLQGSNLQGANLQGADLWGADLQGADLREADLWGADLWGANLQGANLQGANLREADLQGSNLQGANLRGAKRKNKKQHTQPITIMGLSYAVMVWDSHIEIGCKTLTFNQSKKMTAKKAEKLDGETAVDFFNGPWEMVLRVIEFKENQIAEVEEND